METYSEDVASGTGPPSFSPPKKRMRFDGEDPETFSYFDKIEKGITEDCLRYLHSIAPIRAQKRRIPPPDPFKYRSFHQSMGPLINKLAREELKKLLKPKKKKKKVERLKPVLPRWEGGPYHQVEKEETPCKIYDHMNAPSCSHTTKYFDAVTIFEENRTQSWEESNFYVENSLKYGSHDGSMPDALFIVAAEHYAQMDAQALESSLCIEDSTVNDVKLERQGCIEEKPTLIDIPSPIENNNHKEQGDDVTLKDEETEIKKEDHVRIVIRIKKKSRKNGSLGNNEVDRIDMSEATIASLNVVESPVLPQEKKRNKSKSAIQPEFSELLPIPTEYCPPEDFRTSLRDNSIAAQKDSSAYRPNLLKISSTPSDYCPPIDFWTDLGLEVPMEVVEYWKERTMEEIVYSTALRKKKTPSKKIKKRIKSSVPSPVSKETGEELISEPVVEALPVEASTSSSEEHIEEKMDVQDEIPPVVEVSEDRFELTTRPEALSTELHNLYREIPVDNLDSFHSSLVDKMTSLRDSILENREAERAVASVVLREENEDEEEEQEMEEYYTERESSIHNETDYPYMDTSTEFVGQLETTEEDMEEFAEFFPNYPACLPRSLGSAESSSTDRRRSSEEDVDVVGTEEVTTGEINKTSAQSSYYSDSEPSASYSSPESSSEKNIVLEEGSTSEGSSAPIRTHYSSDDEIYPQFPFKDDYPVQDPSVMPSPIASQQ